MQIQMKPKIFVIFIEPQFDLITHFISSIEVGITCSELKQKSIFLLLEIVMGITTDVSI